MYCVPCTVCTKKCSAGASSVKRFFRSIAVTDRHGVDATTATITVHLLVRRQTRLASAPRRARTLYINRVCGFLQEEHAFSRPETSQNYTMEKEHALEEMMGKLGEWYEIFKTCDFRNHLLKGITELPCNYCIKVNFFRVCEITVGLFLEEPVLRSEYRLHVSQASCGHEWLSDQMGAKELSFFKWSSSCL